MKIISLDIPTTLSKYDKIGEGSKFKESIISAPESPGQLQKDRENSKHVVKSGPGPEGFLGGFKSKLGAGHSDTLGNTAIPPEKIHHSPEDEYSMLK